MYMLSRQWDEAYNEFYEAFRAYQVRHTASPPPRHP
jgi:hypothetical protein